MLIGQIMGQNSDTYIGRVVNKISIIVMRLENNNVNTVVVPLIIIVLNVLEPHCY